MDKNTSKLIKNLEKRYTTIMIGALVRFEDAFAHLWQEDSAQSDQYHARWESVRADILDFGNNQSRLATEEMYSYFIRAQQLPYRYEFRIKDNNQTGDQT